jgi:hypothetical protein
MTWETTYFSSTYQGKQSIGSPTEKKRNGPVNYSAGPKVKREMARVARKGRLIMTQKERLNKLALVANEARAAWIKLVAVETVDGRVATEEWIFSEVYDAMDSAITAYYSACVEYVETKGEPGQ